MMNEEQAVAFATEVRARIDDESADIEQIAKDVGARMPEIPPECFQAWARTLVENGGGMKERLQKLNQLLAKDKAFCDTIGAYHKWKNEGGQASPEHMRHMAASFRTLALMERPSEFCQRIAMWHDIFKANPATFEEWKGIVAEWPDEPPSLKSAKEIVAER